MSLFDHSLTINHLPPTVLDSLYSTGSLPAISLDLPVYPNQALLLKSYSNASALCIVSSNGKEVKLLQTKFNLGGIQPRNKEQRVFCTHLSRKEVPLNISVGRAGSGKTLLACAYALNSILMNKEYESVVFTKPMYIVGGQELGAMPGGLDEKYSPYIISYLMQFTEILGENGDPIIGGLIQRGKIKFLPIQLLRGVSFKKTLVIADEIQSLNQHEMKTLCTRIGEGSKLILLGDIAQRDRSLPIQETGLYSLLSSKLILESSLSSVVLMKQNERSQLVDLVESVFNVDRDYEDFGSSD